MCIRDSYIASILTGEVPDPARDIWARVNRDNVMREFALDLAKVRDKSLDGEVRNAAYFRWFANAGRAPEGWPSELGYWVGMQIVKGYVESAADPHAAIRQVLVFDDPAAILALSGIELPEPGAN